MIFSLKCIYQHPPGNSPCIWTFENWFVQISVPQGKNCVQLIPHPMFYVNGQISERNFLLIDQALKLVDFFFWAICLRKWTIYLKRLHIYRYKTYIPMERLPTPAEQGLNPLLDDGRGKGGGGNVKVPNLSAHYEHPIVDANQFYFVLIKNLCVSYTSQFLPYACLMMIGRTAIQSCPTYSPIRCERVPCVIHATNSRELLSHAPFFPRLKHLLFT